MACNAQCVYDVYVSRIILRLRCLIGYSQKHIQGNHKLNTSRHLITVGLLTIGPMAVALVMFSRKIIYFT